MKPEQLTIVLILFISCRTMPVAPYPDVVHWIPVESDMLVHLVVSGNEDLTEILVSLTGLQPETVNPILERTAVFTAGLEMNDEQFDFSTIPIHVAAVGMWPRGVLGSVLGKDWTRRKRNEFVWDGPDGLGIAAPTHELILLSRGRLDSLAAQQPQPPLMSAQRSELFTDADFSLLVSNPDLASRIIPQVAGKIDSFLLTINKDVNQDYSVYFQLTAAREELAPSLALALRIALSARLGKSSIAGEKELLGSLELEVSDERIHLRFPPVDFTLLRSLSVGLNPFER